MTKQIEGTESCWYVKTKIVWKKSNPPKLKDILLHVRCFLDAAGGVELCNENSLKVFLPGRVTYLGADKRWQNRALGRRWIKVDVIDDTVSVKCCVNDLFTIGVANALADSIAAVESFADKAVEVGVT